MVLVYYFLFKLKYNNSFGLIQIIWGTKWKYVPQCVFFLILYTFGDKVGPGYWRAGHVLVQ